MLLHIPSCVVHQSFNIYIWMIFGFFMIFPISNLTQDPESRTVHRIIIALVLIMSSLSPSVRFFMLASDIYFMFLDGYGIRTYFITGCFWIDWRLPCFPFALQDVFWENDLLKISFDPDDLPRTLVKGLNVEQQPAAQWQEKMMTKVCFICFHLSARPSQLLEAKFVWD